MTLHDTGCCFQLIFSYVKTSVSLLLNFIQNSFYNKLIFVKVNSSSFSLLISLSKTKSHCWKWHMALHEKMTLSGKCLQGNNSSVPALIPQCLPPHYYSWYLWSRAEPAAPPRPILWLLGIRVTPPHQGLLSPMKNAREIEEGASLTYFSSSSHPFTSYAHISAPTSKLHIHPRISVGWWKKKIWRKWGTKKQHFPPHFCICEERLKARVTVLHLSVSGEWMEKVKSIQMPIFISDAKS